MVRVQLRAVRVDFQSNTPVLLLQESEGDGRTLPIFIGTVEATAIAYALQGVDVPRPLTHDLLVDVVHSMGAVLEKIVVNDLEGSTFYAELYLRTDEETVVVSARPSDAVALAVRTSSPLFVADHLMDSEAVFIAVDDEDDEDDEGDEEDVVEEFREFLDQLRPEDFEG
ncbi:MAG: bifunctional nuclease family protein [Actinomycetes bacterium]